MLLIRIRVHNRPTKDHGGNQARGLWDTVPDSALQTKLGSQVFVFED